MVCCHKIIASFWLRGLFIMGACLLNDCFIANHLLIGLEIVVTHLCSNWSDHKLSVKPSKKQKQGTA